MLIQDNWNKIAISDQNRINWIRITGYKFEDQNNWINSEAFDEIIK